jgi:pimeloyl-ACP methyl ester carboxylesterase
VAAISLSGMGRSDWRETYTFDLYAEEIHACAVAAGLYEAPVKPIYVGHSFGGAAVYYAGIAHPDRPRAVLLVDSGFGRGPPKPEQAAETSAADDMKPPESDRPKRVYPTFEAGLARFRFMPAQPAQNLFVVDWIARHSLKPTDDGEGWTWRFDPMLFPHLDRSGVGELIGKKPGPTAHIYGDRSNVIARSGGRPDILGQEVKKIVIPDSDHHIMVDQPLALVAAIRAVFAYWP